MASWKIVLIASTLLCVPACVSNKPQQAVYDSRYAGNFIVFDDRKHIVIFEREGEAFRPKLAIVGGKFVPGWTLRFLDTVQLKVQQLAWLHGGWLELSQRPQTYDVELRKGNSVSILKGFSDGYYSNQPVKINDSYDYSDGRLVAEPITDSGGLSVGIHGLDKWTSDLNQNGIPETWIVLGDSIQIWEGYKEKHSVLLLDFRRF